MIKKVFLLLLAPYISFMIIESCGNSYFRCDRKETRNITNIYLQYEKHPDPNPFYRDQMRLNTEYDSYFVSNFRFNLLNKSYARSIDIPINPCFQGFSNPLSAISITSSNNFNSNFPAGAELNPLFVGGYYYDTLSKNNFEWENADVQNSNGFLIYNFEIPSIDTLHTLYFKVSLETGEVYFDTLEQVNLLRTHQNY